MNDSSQLLPQLQQATQGLTFQSETDAPMEPFSIPDGQTQTIVPDLILHFGNYAAGTTVNTTALDTFFRPATKEETWHNDEEKATVKRFQALVQLLKDDLSGITVFMVGTREMDVYVVGKSKAGDILGIKTKVVET